MNLVFDFGNVIIEWDKEVFLTAILPHEEDRRRVNETIFESGLWRGMDSGLYTVDEVEEKVNNYLGGEFKEEVHEILWYWYRYVDLYDSVIDKIEELKKKGYNIYILSDTNQVFNDCIKERAPRLMNILDGKVLSYQIRKTKPNREIYQYLLDSFKLDPHNTYFFDDLSLNIKGAERVGIKGYQVIDKEDFLDYLNTF